MPETSSTLALPGRKGNLRRRGGRTFRARSVLTHLTKSQAEDDLSEVARSPWRTIRRWPGPRRLPRRLVRTLESTGDVTTRYIVSPPERADGDDGRPGQIGRAHV